MEPPDDSAPFPLGSDMELRPNLKHADTVAKILRGVDRLFNDGKVEGQSHTLSRPLFRFCQRISGQSHLLTPSPAKGIVTSVSLFKQWIGGNLQLRQQSLQGRETLSARSTIHYTKLQDEFKGKEHRYDAISTLGGMAILHPAEVQFDALNGAELSAPSEVPMVTFG
jgi:hypothetical protein